MKGWFELFNFFVLLVDRIIRKDNGVIVIKFLVKIMVMIFVVCNNILLCVSKIVIIIVVIDCI